MFRAISHLRAPLRSVPLALACLLQSSMSSSPTLSLFKFPSNPSVLSIPILSLPFSYSLSRQKHGDSCADEFNRDPNRPPKLLVVQPRLRPDSLLKAKLDEALNLANSLEEQRDGYYDTEFLEKESPPHIVVQNPAYRSCRADTYFGSGTVETIKCHLNAMDSKKELDAVFVNTVLTGIQQRNLERAWEKPVLDRVGLIIEIFNAHAQTKEAKLQAELAVLMYKRTRLVRVLGPDGRYTFGTLGEAQVVSARGRGSGGRGFIGGAGETELQLQQRRILDRRTQLLSEIKEVRRTRALQRASRKKHGGSRGVELATIAVVGYTNAGKSTLVSTLSDSDLYCDDRLFATVDPKLRNVILPSGRKVLFSDTVGFISDLPVQLVEAFHATLEEVIEADLLLHIVDSNAPNLDEQRQTVLQVLEQIGVSEEKIQNMIEVWNKIDLNEVEMGGEEFNNDLSSYSGIEDDGIASEQIDEEDQIGDVSNDRLSPGSDGWFSTADEQEETWDDYDRSFSRKDEQDLSLIRKPQPESVPHVRISAATGVGLQELLKLIDERLKRSEVAERNRSGAEESNIYHRKWRPLRAEDSSVLVEQ